MMTPAKASPFLDWHWLATYVLAVLIMLLGSLARELNASVHSQEQQIIALKLVDERREEQLRSMTRQLDRIEALHLQLFARLDSLARKTDRCVMRP